MITDSRGMSLPRDQKQEEEHPGSHDRDLHSPKGHAARYVLHHRQFPYRVDATPGFYP